MDPVQTMTVIYVFFGLLLAALAVPLIMRKVKPNPFYGFRLPKTMNNPDIWYEINAYSGRWLLAVGLGSALVAAMLYLLAPGLGVDLIASIQGIAVVVLLAVAMWFSLNKLKTL